MITYDEWLSGREALQKSHGVYTAQAPKNSNDVRVFTSGEMFCPEKHRDSFIEKLEALTQQFYEHEMLGY